MQAEKQTENRKIDSLTSKINILIFFKALKTNYLNVIFSPGCFFQISKIGKQMKRRQLRTDGTYL